MEKEVVEGPNGLVESLGERRWHGYGGGHLKNGPVFWRIGYALVVVS